MFAVLVSVIPIFLHSIFTTGLISPLTVLHSPLMIINLLFWLFTSTHNTVQLWITLKSSLTVWFFVVRLPKNLVWLSVWLSTNKIFFNNFYSSKQKISPPKFNFDGEFFWLSYFTISKRYVSAVLFAESLTVIRTLYVPVSVGLKDTDDVVEYAFKVFHELEPFVID